MRDVVNRGRHLFSQGPFFLEATSGFQTKQKCWEKLGTLFLLYVTPLLAMAFACHQQTLISFKHHKVKLR